MNDTNRLSGTVLIVEDHEPTSHLLELAFEKTAPKISTERLETGEEAIRRLKEIDEGAPIPDLILLDLDLPVKNGYDVLEWRNEVDILSWIPAVVLSGTSTNTAVSQCYDLNVQSYITKPEDWEGFVELATLLVDYWFKHANNLSVHPCSEIENSGLKSIQ